MAKGELGLDFFSLIEKHHLRVKPVLAFDGEIEFWAVGHVKLSSDRWMSYVELEHLAQDKDLKEAILKAISLYGGDENA